MGQDRFFFRWLTLRRVVVLEGWPFKGWLDKTLFLGVCQKMVGTDFLRRLTFEKDWQSDLFVVEVCPFFEQ